ncbi:MAG: hypothetical protein LBC02_12765 [Planctomycetaceae bacterium]|jgi:hypothetical protein|nr:hypothetical protein [Planctomycetaceae bacterium]
MAGGNKTQRSNRLDLSKNMAFTFIIRIFWQFHAVTALRSRLPCLGLRLCGRDARVPTKDPFVTVQSIVQTIEFLFIFDEWFSDIPRLGNFFTDTVIIACSVIKDDWKNFCNISVEIFLCCFVK